MTEPGGAAWRQTIYYPYYFASRLRPRHGAAASVKSPGYDADVGDNVPYLDISGVHDEDGKTLTFFAVNRHPSTRARSRCAVEGSEMPGWSEQVEMTTWRSGNRQHRLRGRRRSPRVNVESGKIEDGRGSVRR